MFHPSFVLPIASLPMLYMYIYILCDHRGSCSRHLAAILQLLSFRLPRAHCSYGFCNIFYCMWWPKAQITSIFWHYIGIWLNFPTLDFKPFDKNNYGQYSNSFYKLKTNYKALIHLYSTSASFQWTFTPIFAVKVLWRRVIVSLARLRLVFTVVVVVVVAILSSMHRDQ